MLTKKTYTHLLADAYYAAALAGADMRQVTDALESVRAALESGDYFAAWDAIDGQIGSADDAAVVGALMQLRTQFEKKVFQNELARLRKIFQRDPQAGWKAWLITYGNAFMQSRLSLCIALSSADLRFPEQERPHVAAVGRAEYYIKQGRYVEAYDTYPYLAGQTVLPRRVRASALVDAAIIQIYYLNLLSKAEVLLQQAHQLAPEESRVLAGWGLYWMQKNEFEKAKEKLEQGIQADAQYVANYLFMGDLFDRQKDLEQAEQWYLKGLAVNPGDSSAYIRLMRLYLRKDWSSIASRFNESETAKRRKTAEELLERANRVDPLGTYNNYLEIGFSYQQREEYDKADSWYRKAIALEKSFINAYVFQGNALIEQKSDGWQQKAEKAFRKIIEVASEVFDGYWFMGLLNEQLERWKEALAWYEQGLLHGKPWENAIRAKIGEMLLRDHRHSEAEKTLFDALQVVQADPADESIQNIVNVLESLASDYYKQQKDVAAALRVYEKTRQIRGDRYEAAYQNLVGNLRYYQKEFQEATIAFSRAIDASPKDDVLYSNLSDAWENVRRPGNRGDELRHAIAALNEALLLKQFDVDYSDRLERLELELKVVEQLSEPALKFIPQVNRLEIGVAPDLLPYIVESGTGALLASVQVVINDIRSRLRQVSGLILPGINFTDLPGEPPGTYVIKIWNVPKYVGRLPSNVRFSPLPLEAFASLNLKPDEVYDEDFGGKGCWVAGADWPIVEEHGLPLWQIIEYPLRMLEKSLQSDLSLLLDHQQILWWLEGTKTDAAVKIKQSPKSRGDLIHVLKALVRESIPVTAVDQICSSFIELQDRGMNLAAIVEALRSRPELLAMLPGRSNDYVYYRFGSSIGPFMQQYIKTEGDQPVLLMEEGEYRGMLGSMQKLLKDYPPNHPFAFIIPTTPPSTPDLRPLFRTLLEEAFPGIPVVAEQELLPDFESRVVVTINTASAANVAHEQEQTHAERPA